jgi:hypothetical protein
VCALIAVKSPLCRAFNFKTASGGAVSIRLTLTPDLWGARARILGTPLECGVIGMLSPLTRCALALNRLSVRITTPTATGNETG